MFEDLEFQHMEHEAHREEEREQVGARRALVAQKLQHREVMDLFIGYSQYVLEQLAIIIFICYSLN